MAQFKIHSSGCVTELCFSVRGISVNTITTKRRSRRPGPHTLGSAPRAMGTGSDIKIEKTQSTTGSHKNGPTKEIEPTPVKSTTIENEPAHGKSSTKKPVSLKRGQADIFKSFAKSKPKLQKEDTESSAAASLLSAMESVSAQIYSDAVIF